MFPPSNSLPHLRWQRLPDTAHRRTRPNPAGYRFPLRTDVHGHANTLRAQTADVVSSSQALRAGFNIDPEKLVVLELRFLEMGQREHLQRLGVRVVDEEEQRLPLAQPKFIVLVKFQSETFLDSFIAAGSASTVGASGLERKRSSDGGVDSRNLVLEFSERDSAAQFLSDKANETQFGFTFKSTAPTKVSFKTAYRLLSEFPDASTLNTFRSELDEYQKNSGQRTTAFTSNQRRELFDALDEVAHLGPVDRMGARLAESPISDPDAESYFDVDLWHPGAQSLREAVAQFNEVVASAGGRVTDSPRSVAETLLLARVHGKKSLLEMLLNYDRVALVDLPPSEPIADFGPLSHVDVPSQIPSVPIDGPLACIVDSGIVAGHPLLRGTVVDERDFDSGEDSPVDRVGHGTHMAGIVVYGDLRAAIASNSWVPQVRILSAKVMRLSEFGHAEFANEKRVETQVSEAISTFASEYGCRVFNLSFGHGHRLYRGGRQLPWAQMLDELSRRLDVVLVVSAGNVPDPELPQAMTVDNLQVALKEQLLTPDHALIDPATAMLSLTVGAVAHSEATYSPGMREQDRPPIAAAPSHCPSPFTRSGMVESDGPAPKRAIKPELVGYGGNYALGSLGGTWSKKDPFLGVPSLKFDYQGSGLLSAQCGTSPAAAYVTHCASIVEAELRRQLGPDRKPSGNLIRCLTVHGGRVREEVANWIGPNGDVAAEDRVLRLMGYGLPDPGRAAFSDDQRVTLYAEDRVQEDHFHLYELELPEEFLSRSGPRCIRVSLSYDPPTRGSRREYMGRTMWFKLYRGLTSQAILQAMGRSEGSGEQPQLPAVNEFKGRPPFSSLQWSANQSAVFEGANRRAFNYRTAEDSPAVVHLLVGCTARFPAEAANMQSYAIALSVEHSDATIQLHQVIRQRIEQRVRIGV